MSLLWAVPPIAAASAALLILAHLRTMTGAAAELAEQLRRLDEVRVAVTAVREGSTSARNTVRSLRSR